MIEAVSDRIATRAAEEEAAEQAKAARAVNFEPLGDRILAKRYEEQGEKMIGSIVVPDQAKDKPMEADVIAVGQGRTLDTGALSPMYVKPGDRILIGKYSGTEVKLNDEEFLILRADEIFGRLTKAHQCSRTCPEFHPDRG